MSKDRARVQVWVTGPDSDWLPPDHLFTVLSAQERERALSLNRQPGACDRFVRSRTLRRAILAEATGRRAEELRYQIGPHGKPSVPGGPGFSVSDSGTFICVAVAADDRALGVDIEEIRPLSNPVINSIARRFLAEETEELLSSLPSGQRTTAFYQAWTHYEAFMKATGEGMRPRGATRALRLDGGADCVSASFRLQASVTGSVCVHGDAMTLRILPVPRQLGGVRLLH